MVASIATSLLVGCGTTQTTSDNTTNDTTTSEKMQESEVIEETQAVEESEVVENTEVSSEETFIESYSWTFSEGMDGWTDKWIYADDLEWSYNQTHYVDVNGNTMNFKWEGPTGLGARAGLSPNGTTLILKNSSGEYALRAFTTGELSPETYDEIKSYDKETIISFAAKDSPYITDGYYDSNIGDTYMSFTFAVASDTQKGYNHYIMDREKGLCYQFVYLENNDIYDDTRAMIVINSLDFWNYEE